MLTLNGSVLLLILLNIQIDTLKCVLHHNPHFQDKRGVVVKLSYWQFNDVANECIEFLGPQGYGAVQVSSITEHILGESVNEPISYHFSSIFGSKDDFLAMTHACNAAGVRVYVDVQLNNMAGISTNSSDMIAGSEGSLAYPKELKYEGVPFYKEHFHKSCQLLNYDDGHIIRNCQKPPGLPDLDHSKLHVREKIIEFLNKLIDLGVAGFHVLDAKFMWPVDLKTIYEAVKTLNSKDFDFATQLRPLFYQDVLDFNNESTAKTEYIEYGLVSEQFYGKQLNLIASGESALASLIENWRKIHMLAHEDAYVFIKTKLYNNNHDDDDDYDDEYIGNQHSHMSNLLMLALPYGCLKSIESVDDGGILTGRNAAKAIHRWPSFVKLLQLVSTFPVDRITNFQLGNSSKQQLAYCHGNGAYIAINLATEKSWRFEAEVEACLSVPGSYCDVITGGRQSDGLDCHGTTVKLKKGNAWIEISAGTMLAISEASKLIATDESNAMNLNSTTIVIDDLTYTSVDFSSTIENINDTYF